MQLKTMPLKFRVWGKELKRFVQYSDIYDSSYDQSKNELEVIDLAHYFYNTDEKLDNVVISQDTGIKDKNGKSIYTGDIVSDGAVCGIVEYYNGLLGLRFDKYEATIASQAELNEFKNVEIIGNIWQNPELLEENMG